MFKIPQWLPNRLKAESKSLFSSAHVILPGLGHFIVFLIFPALFSPLPAILPPFLVFKPLLQAHMQIDSLSAVEVSLPEIFFSHVGHVTHPIRPRVSFPDSHGFSCMCYSAVHDDLQTTLSPAIPSPCFTFASHTLTF